MHVYRWDTSAVDAGRASIVDHAHARPNPRACFRDTTVPVRPARRGLPSSVTEKVVSARPATGPKPISAQGPLDVSWKYFLLQIVIIYSFLIKKYFLRTTCWHKRLRLPERSRIKIVNNLVIRRIEKLITYTQKVTKRRIF